MLDMCAEVKCIFILDPKQISPKQNKYFSMNAVLFMIDSLLELKKNINVSILTGEPTEVVGGLITKHKFNVVGFNEDYTPYAVLRDNSIEKLCSKLSVSCKKYPDVAINTPYSIKPYKVFTPYYNVASGSVAKPVKRNISSNGEKSSNLITVSAKSISKLPEKQADLIKLRASVESICKKSGVDLNMVQRGGRELALLCIKKFNCSKYSKNRDLFVDGTSRLGPHLKFGTVSVREVYYACTDKTFRKQLYWRDFYMQIAYHFPQVFGNNFKNVIKWENSATNFKKWCNGETGYPIVDACMKHMNKSGFMPNRGRMIVASFLTKILHIDWRWGERYFATRLTDYDPSNNNGGWQWSAGTGVDAQPYFRIFNPFTQADNYDPDFSYRDRWLGKSWRDESLPKKYIVDYDVERVRALKLIK